MQYNPSGDTFVDVDGMLVERDALRVAEAIKEYDPNLDILCLDPDRADSITEEPFIVVERCKDGNYRPILRAWKLDYTVYMRVVAADQQKFNGLATLEQWEADQKKQNERRYQDFREEARDIVAHIGGMKSKYTVRDSNTGEMLTFYDDRPATRR